MAKSFCAGAFSTSRSYAAFVVISRVSGGSAPLLDYGRVRAPSAIMVEAWALSIACGMAMDHGLEEVIFESDNLQLINSVCNGASSCPWEIRSLVEYVLLRGHGHAKVWMKEQRSGTVLYTSVIFCRLLYLKILQMHESGRDIAV